MIKFLWQYTVGGIFLLLLGFLLAGIYIDRPEAGEQATFIVPAGATAKQVARLLDEQKIIQYGSGYRVYAVFSSVAKKPKAGSYQISRGLGYKAIAKELALGPARNETQVRLIEGWNVDDIVSYLSKENGIDSASTERLTGKSADRAAFDDSLRADFPFLKSLPANRSLEGYLYPDTYRVWQDQLPDGLIRKQLQTFADRYADVKVTEASAPLKTLDEVVILASIVEREVRGADERKIVAGIFLNRLRIGMALQSDATLSYVLDSKRAQASAKDLETESLYNSYKHPGLPPGPISNPAATAIDAVLNPTKTSYFYFLTDKKGKVFYAKTFEEHVANRRKAGY